MFGFGRRRRRRAEELEAARRALREGVARAEAVIEQIMEQVDDPRDRRALAAAIERHVAEHGEPRFQVLCPACGDKVADVPLVYPSARGLTSWMPPGYLAARFAADEEARRCPGCGAAFPRVEWPPAR